MALCYLITHWRSPRGYVGTRSDRGQPRAISGQPQASLRGPGGGWRRGETDPRLEHRHQAPRGGRERPRRRRKRNCCKAAGKTRELGTTLLPSAPVRPPLLVRQSLPLINGTRGTGQLAETGGSRNRCPLPAANRATATHSTPIFLRNLVPGSRVHS